MLAIEYPVPSIPGVKAEGQLLHAFRREIADLLGRSSIGFPGAQPVSFGAKHKLELQKQDYYVCEKSDGVRCLMYLTSDDQDEVTYLVDRKNDYYHVTNLHFPILNDECAFHTGTLVDGELVNDRHPDGTLQLKYLVFDCLMLDGSTLMHRTLDKRLAYFRDKVYTPYQALYKKYPAEKQYLPFTVEIKHMELGYGIEKMFHEILPNLAHENDGLIFTCRNTPYQFGTDPHILKWKPEKENSIDFRLNFEWPIIEPGSEEYEDDGTGTSYLDYLALPIFHLSIYKGDGIDIPYDVMFVEEEEWEHMKSLGEKLEDRIVECYLDEKSRWRFLRFRDDKLEANYISTVESVIESIRDRVTQDDLIRIAWKIREEWKKRLAGDESKTKEDNQARESAGTDVVANGHGPAGSKRKAKDSEHLASPHGATRRKISPAGDDKIESSFPRTDHHDGDDVNSIPQSHEAEGHSSPTSSGGGGHSQSGVKRKGDEDEPMKSPHS